MILHLKYLTRKLLKIAIIMFTKSDKFTIIIVENCVVNLLSAIKGNLIMRITPCVSSPVKAVNAYHIKSAKKNSARFNTLYQTCPKVPINQNFTGNWFGFSALKKKTNYLDYINTTTDSPQEVKNTLLSALNDDNSRDNFINTLIQDPKNLRR